MACAISGAYLGIECIPQVWIEKLENRPYIEDLALRLSQFRVGPSYDIDIPGKIFQK